jgi:hypothetical protein
MTDHTTLGAGVGRAALVGAAVGFLLVTCLAMAITRLAGLGPLDALGVGAFAALWGGPGFGAMFGAVTVINRNEADREATSPETDRATAKSQA